MRSRDVDGARVGDKSLLEDTLGDVLAVGVLPLLSLALESLEVLKVALGDVGSVLSAEDADFEPVDLAVALGGVLACVLEIFEVLVDYVVGGDVLGDLLAGAFVGY